MVVQAQDNEDHNLKRVTFILEGVEKPVYVHNHSPAELREVLRAQSAIGVFKIDKNGEREARCKVATVNFEDGATYFLEVFGSAIKEQVKNHEKCRDHCMEALEQISALSLETAAKQAGHSEVAAAECPRKVQSKTLASGGQPAVLPAFEFDFLATSSTTVFAGETKLHVNEADFSELANKTAKLRERIKLDDSFQNLRARTVQPVMATFALPTDRTRLLQIRRAMKKNRIPLLVPGAMLQPYLRLLPSPDECS